MSQSTNVYPQGSKTTFYRKYVNGVLKFFRRSDHTEFFSIDGAYGQLNVPNLKRTLRHRVTLAQVKAGHTLLPALPGYKYRLVDLTLIALGGAAATSTSVDVAGTRGGSPVLLAVTDVGGLTQSTRVSIGEQTESVILADGASFTACDANTAITIADAVADSLTGCTDGIDVIIQYCIDKA
jgi:hypothetical protein